VGETRLEQIREIAQARGLEFFFAQFVDLYGRPSAKLVPVSNLDDLVENGAGFAGFAAGEIGQQPSDPDIAAIPDLDSLTLVPWEPNLARFACDVTVEGEPWPYCPRTILRRELERARGLGFELKLGLELEYFLLRRADDGSLVIADAADTLEKPCYDMAGLTRQYEFLTTVSRYCNELGWGNYANDHEDANGQFEQNFTYDDALVSCDRAIFFRYMVHTLAEQRGMIATFMPKPFTHLTGNGCHFHMSLWRDDRNLFLDPDDPRGLGLSETAYHFIGGLKAHARASSALTAPTVNSYKRLKLGTTSSGATWAPVWISYGSNNRTQMLRIPGPGRVEDRTIDGSANPTWPPPPCSRPASTGSRTVSTPRSPTGRTSTPRATTRSRPSACARCPRTFSRLWSSSSATTSCGARSGRAAARTTSTTTRRSSGTSGSATTSR